MSEELEVIPQIVKDLAETVGQPIMKWRLEEAEIIIIFASGQKMKFPRPSSAPTTVEIARPPSQPVTSPVAVATRAPRLQRLPVKRGRKS